MPAAGLEALGIQEIAQHPAARERQLAMQRVHAPHHGEIGRRHGTRQVINAATAEFQRLCLPRDRQIVLLVDHRFALSMPTLLSAPSQKSFSSVNSPIFAWSDFKSTAGAAGPASAESKPLKKYGFWGCSPSTWDRK